MAYIIIIILSTVFAVCVGGFVGKKRLNKIEKNKNNFTITYDKYFLGTIGFLLVLILIAIIGMLVALFWGGGAYGSEDEGVFMGLLLVLTVGGIMYAIAFLSLKSWKISLDGNKLVYKTLFSIVAISYDELRIVTIKKKIIVEKGYLKIPGPKGYIKVNQSITSSGTYFKDVLMERVGLDDSALCMIEKNKK
jgi:hypothetical protein